MEVLVGCQTASLTVNDLVLRVIKNLGNIPHTINRFSPELNDFLGAFFALFFFKSPARWFLNWFISTWSCLGDSSNLPCASFLFLSKPMLRCPNLSPHPTSLSPTLPLWGDVSRWTTTLLPAITRLSHAVQSEQESRFTHSLMNQQESSSALIDTACCPSAIQEC